MTNKEDKKEEKNKKQGEDPKITNTAEGNDKDFKSSGVEGTKETKDDAGETKDEKEELTRLKKENGNLQTENSRLKKENAKLLTQTTENEESKDKEKKEKTYVTGEDAIKKMRAGGHKI
ncbi:MAG: hypothetical protein GY774_16555 [Planctomycetes bacterium]|nr:hypothetical protein [Planctomycetota bacterium]